MHRPRDVLDLLFAQILEAEAELVAHLIAHDTADANSTGRRQRFEAGGDIDAVAEDVAVLADDDVAEVDADAQHHRVRVLTPFGARAHFALDHDGAAHRIDHAAEFDQEPVAGGLDDTAVMLLDLGVGDFAPDRFERKQGPFLVRTHQPRIGDDIGGQDRRQPSLGA